MNRIIIQSKVIGSVKNQNRKFTCLQVLQLLLLFPFFSVKNAANYSTSSLSRMFVCHKDMFYRFLNDGNINWRGIIYSVFRQLYSRVSRKTTSKLEIKCVIAELLNCDTMALTEHVISNYKKIKKSERNEVRLR